MNALLIHNDNLPTNLIDNFTYTLLFRIPQSTMLEEGFSFDKEVHNQVGKIFKEKSIDVIFLPYSLSENYLELTGLRMALHIRLTPEWNHTRIPIVFIGHETINQIAKLSELGSFLFTTGVFSTQEFIFEDLKKQYEWITKEWRGEAKPLLNDNEYSTFLSRINIQPPANYQTHHSIDNELALVRWSVYLKCDDKISEVKENIQKGLYFKYQRVLYPIEPVKDHKSDLINRKANVLLIDDEADKGWKDFYKVFLKKSHNISFDYLQHDFKSSSQQEIIEKAKTKAIEFDADIVLLDLRLCDSDFTSQVKPEDLTGYKILEEIKKINKGIQVIIITASNKVWNLQALLEAGTDGYIIKNGNSDVSEDIRNLKTIFENCINKSSILKTIHESFEKIKSFAINLSDSFKKNIETNVSISFELLEKSFPTPKYRNYAYLQLFHIVEEFIKEDSVFEFGDNCYVVTPSKRYLVLSKKDPTKEHSPYKSALTWANGHYKVGKSEYKRRIDTNAILSSILLFRYGLPTSGSKNWSKIYSVRNQKAAHPEVGIVEFSEINMLSRFLEFILDESNINPIDSNQALTELSPEEQVENLKKIWGVK
jgi:CheY-like chemotaxis protein